MGRWLHLSVAAAFGHLLAPPADFKALNKVEGHGNGYCFREAAKGGVLISSP